MIAIRGAGSNIVTALVRLIDGGDQISIVARHETVPPQALRYFYCQGLLLGARISDQRPDQLAETLRVNALGVIDEIDALVATNPRARVCVVGSESAFTWSYDGAYAAAKAALHRYVETKKLRTPDQQLVCVSPGIIRDSGMTERRLDQDRLEERRAQHPKRRFLDSVEVARLVYHCLYVDRGYLSGVVLRLNGGEHIR